MEPELVITRVFDAPVERLWAVWTEAEHLKHWWGPKGMTMAVAQLDLRPGGVFHYSLRTPAGQEMWGKFVYREVAAPARLVYVNSFSDAEGNLVRHPMAATWPLEVLNTMTFEPHEGGTMLRLSGGPINANEEERATFVGALEGVKQGFAGTMAQLDAYLATLK